MQFVRSAAVAVAFGLSVASLGSNIIIGAPGTGGQGSWYAVGAAYLYDSQGNLLRTFYEPTPAFPDFFGGSVIGVAFGVAFVSILSNGLNLLNVSSYTQMMVIGAALILAVAMDQLLVRRGSN